MKKNKGVVSKNTRVISEVDKAISLLFASDAEVAQVFTAHIARRIQALRVTKQQLETVYYDADIDKTAIALLLGEIDHAIAILAERLN